MGALSAVDHISGAQFGYEPDHAAPVEGAFDKSGSTPVWRQQHHALVQDALHSYKGHTSTMHLHMASHLAGESTPDSGTGKRMRTQAAALLHEMQVNSRPSPAPLYRGASRADDGSGLPVGYSESKRVARGFARTNEGQVYSRPAGTPGLRVADYISSGVDQDEKEWLIR